MNAANERVKAVEQLLSEQQGREKVLADHIHHLENGPGCARELREQLEAAELKLNQEEARQRQRRVMAEMLTVSPVIFRSSEPPRAMKPAR